MDFELLSGKCAPSAWAQPDANSPSIPACFDRKGPGRRKSCVRGLADGFRRLCSVWYALQIQQLLFQRQTGGKSGQAAVLPQYPMAGNQSQAGIAPYGLRNRPDCHGAADGRGHLAVTPGLPIGDFPQLLPNRFLKRRSFRYNRCGKNCSSVNKVFLQFLYGLSGNLIFMDRYFRIRWKDPRDSLNGPGNAPHSIRRFKLTDVNH